jgi:ATP-dependent helicase/nuclease subunit B
MRPEQRPLHWTQMRELLGPLGGPGATERLLARVALEWASLAPAPASDRLFDIPAPSAWIVVQAGGPDPLCERLMTEALVPCLRVDTDVSEEDPFQRCGREPPAAFGVCDGFEHEAQCTAAQVLAHVARGEVPVALIAQDRVLVRRVRALLERAELRLLDESGWKLSTTRAAAEVMAFLNAARGDAGTDALLDWLKASAAAADANLAGDISALEAACRRDQIARVAALPRAELDPSAARMWAAASSVLALLPVSKRQDLSAWLAQLTAALAACGALARLQSDDAGQKVIGALRLGTSAAGTAWSLVASQAVMGFDEFRAWADRVLEDATFTPAVASDDPAQVVITPLASAMLRPFAAAVFPGADDKRLGAAPTSVSLLSDAQAAAFGIKTAAQRRHSELLAFAQILDMPNVSLLRRRADGSDPLADSPLVERLALALATHGKSLAPWHDPRLPVTLAPTPIHMTAPGAPTLLPERLSASACEALRACPYRFFALHVLRLREDQELEREVEKRDYGTWLHEVLFEFHKAREAPGASEAEVAQLMRLAKASQINQGLSDADFLPFAASFESFAPRYIAWLHERDADGAWWKSGEESVSTRPVALDGTELYGVIDRIDEWRNASDPAIELIDYKTGSAAGLRDKVKEPLEDTQLAFYAALMRSRTDVPISASYLALDGSKGIEKIEHKAVEESAAILVEGLALDLRRLRAGAGLPALGEGSTCEHCAARGICRRDHWADDVTEAPQP